MTEIVLTQNSMPSRFNMLKKDDSLANSQPVFFLDDESRLLAALLKAGRPVNGVTSSIKAEDFMDPRHQVLFEALVELTKDGSDFDLVDVINALMAKGQEEAAGSRFYLNQLHQFDLDCSQAKIDHYAISLRELSLSRRLAGFGLDIQAKAQASSFRLNRDVRLRMREQLDAILEDDLDMLKVDQDGIGHSVEKLFRVISGQEERKPGSIVYTGLPNVDKAIGGLHAGEVVVVAAPPGMGKSSFGWQILDSVACLNERLHSVFFSLEMTADQLMIRAASSAFEIDSKAIQAGEFHLSQSDVEKLATMPDRFKLPSGEDAITIVHKADMTVSQIRERARRAKKKYGTLGVIVIDYLQLIDLGDVGSNNRAQAIGDVTKSIKAMASELECAVILLSQINRNGVSKGSAPKMTNLRDSGRIEEDAATVIFLHRDNYFDDGANKDLPTPIKLVIPKNRHGSACEAGALWVPFCTKFKDLPL